MYKRALIGIVLIACLPAAAQTFAQRVAQADALLERQPDAALGQFQQIQVDYPNAPEVTLGIGAAQYKRAEMAASQGQQEQARALFAAAQETFERLLAAPSAAVRRHAGFNYANALAKLAEAHDAHQRQEQIETLERAVSAYEALLTDHPGDTGVEQNLDHVRYVLKRLLQQQSDEEEQPQRPPIFLQATTDLEGKEAVVNEHRVELIEADVDANANADAGGDEQ